VARGGDDGLSWLGEGGARSAVGSKDGEGGGTGGHTSSGQPAEAVGVGACEFGKDETECEGTEAEEAAEDGWGMGMCGASCDNTEVEVAVGRVGAGNRRGGSKGGAAVEDGVARLLRTMQKPRLASVPGLADASVATLGVWVLGTPGGHDVGASTVPLPAPPSNVKVAWREVPVEGVRITARRACRIRGPVASACPPCFGPQVEADGHASVRGMRGACTRGRVVRRGDNGLACIATGAWVAGAAPISQS